MANTVIQLKWSEVTATPTSLNVAEPAYSNTSGKLFIGQAGNQVIAVGGKYYTDLVDAATNLNTASAIVKRDSSGNFSAGTITATLFGNANTATTLQTSRLIGVSGDIVTNTVSFNGSTNANLNVTLAATGVTAATYGGATQIPTFVVDAKGRITSAANVAISTSLSIAGDTGTDTVALNGGTLTFEGGDGITSAVTNDKASFAVDNTVVRTTGGTITGDLAITGNLVISGNTVTQDVETMKVEDSLIQLAANNAADAVDIGFFGQYNDGTTKYTTFFRDASDSGRFKLLTGGTTIPSAANSVDPTTYTTGTLVANITGGTVSGLSADISVADGGTGAGSFTAGGIIMGNGTGALSVLANTGTAGTYGGVDRTLTVTTDAYGRVSAVTNSAIAISAAAVTSGTLPIARGGTNQTSFTAGQRLVFDGTSLASQANTTTTVTGGLSAANTITSISYNAYGDITAYTGGAIAIAASQVTSGTLTTARGGTGLSSFTAQGVFYASSTSAISQATSSTEGHILTINASGVPTFSHLSGGTF